MIQLPTVLTRGLSFAKAPFTSSSGSTRDSVEGSVPARTEVGLKAMLQATGQSPVSPAAKQAIDSMLVTDVPVSTAEKNKLYSILSEYPTSVLQQVAADGLKLYILADYPQPPGKLRPTDLGATGDDGGDTVQMPTSDGGTTTVSINQAIVGANLPDKNILYFYHGLLGDKTPQLGTYTIRHEFAHAADFSTRKHEADWHASVQKLYDAAQNHEPGHDFVDAYAASNADEYFAVAVQSYLTPSPLRDESGQFDISADWNGNLKARDPAMYQFVQNWLTSKA